MQKTVKTETLRRTGTGRTCVLVLGMHRSGTSALTRVLSLLGCDLPKTLLDANPTNEAGHWESVEIMGLNNEILHSAGSNWHDWLEFNQGWYTSPKAEEFKGRALDLLKSEYGRSGLFVLKDPRICRFAPFWIDVLQSEGIKPVVVTEVRNPLEVAESLSKRSEFDPALGHLLWLRHLLDAEVASRDYQRYYTSYDGLLDDWPRIISEMQDSLGISWPRLSVKTGEEIGSFLNDRLRHHRQSPEGVTANPFLSVWLRDAFTIFSRWAAHGEALEDRTELDRIRAELEAAAPAFARLILSGQQRAEALKAARGQVEEQKKQLEALDSEHQALAEKESGLISDLAGVRTQLESVQGDLSQAEGALHDANAGLAGLKAELSVAQSALAQRTAEVDEVRIQLHEANSGFADLKAELSQTQSALAQRSAEADEVTAQIHAVKAELEAAKNARQQEADRGQSLAGELDRLRGDHDELQARLTDAERARRELETERTSTNDQLERLRFEKGAVEERLTERFSELAALTRLLGDKETELASKLRLLDKRKDLLDKRKEELAAQKRQLKKAEKSASLATEQIAVLREASAALLNGSRSRSLKSRLAAMLPAFRIRHLEAKLKSAGIFDPDAYLAANPDVAQAGQEPLRHFINQGIGENRKLRPIPREEPKGGHE